MAKSTKEIVNRILGDTSSKNKYDEKETQKYIDENKGRFIDDSNYWKLKPIRQGLVK